MYKVSLEANSEIYTAEASTPHEAIMQLKPPAVIKTWAVFKLEHEGKTSTLKKNSLRGQLAVSRGNFALVLGRNLERLLK